MVFCKNCKYYKHRIKTYSLFEYFSYDERCAIEMKIDYILDPIKGYEKKVIMDRTPYSKNKSCDCSDYKVKWWKALFIKNIEKSREEKNGKNNKFHINR